MIATLHAFNTLAGTVHGGALAVFALLLIFRSKIPHVRDEDIVRIYRAFGGGMGVSLGVFIGTELFRHVTGLNAGLPLPGAMALHWETANEAMLSSKLLLLFVAWVSYIHLEVWTMEPARQLDQAGHISRPDAYADATVRITRQLSFNAVCFTAILVIGSLTEGWP